MEENWVESQTSNYDSSPALPFNMVLCKDRMVGQGSWKIIPKLRAATSFEGQNGFGTRSLENDRLLNRLHTRIKMDADDGSCQLLFVIGLDIFKFYLAHQILLPIDAIREFRDTFSVSNVTKCLVLTWPIEFEVLKSIWNCVRSKTQHLDVIV